MHTVLTFIGDVLAFLIGGVSLQLFLDTTDSKKQRNNLIICLCLLILIANIFH